jgi:hypothetical protein
MESKGTWNWGCGNFLPPRERRAPRRGDLDLVFEKRFTAKAQRSWRDAEEDFTLP